MIFMLDFFFSSRRRHTRSKRDWSSDVCSSDLSAFPTVFSWDYRIRHAELLRLYEKGKTLQWNASTDIDWSIDVDPERLTARSEERRVGKEWRPRSSTDA